MGREISAFGHKKGQLYGVHTETVSPHYTMSFSCTDNIAPHLLQWGIYCPNLTEGDFVIKSSKNSSPVLLTFCAVYSPQAICASGAQLTPFLIKPFFFCLNPYKNLEDFFLSFLWINLFIGKFAFLAIVIILFWAWHHIFSTITSCISW